MRFTRGQAKEMSERLRGAFGDVEFVLDWKPLLETSCGKSGNEQVVCT